MEIDDQTRLQSVFVWPRNCLGLGKHPSTDFTGFLNFTTPKPLQNTLQLISSHPKKSPREGTTGQLHRVRSWWRCLVVTTAQKRASC